MSVSRDVGRKGGAIVVRGGVLGSFEEFRESVQDHYARSKRETGTGVYGSSVCSLPDLSAEEILRAIPGQKVPHGRFRETTVGAVRELGFDIYPSEWFGHATLEFPALPTEDDWEKLQQIFSDPKKNPVAASHRKKT